MVRQLTIAELHDAAKMGHDFFNEGKLPGKFVIDVFMKKWTSLIEINVAFVLGLFSGDKVVGAFGAMVLEDINDGELVAAEAFWFVDEAHRGRGLELLVAYEKEAKARGAVRCSMIHLLSLQPERLGELYKRRGYQPVETSYFKNLT